MKRHYRLRRNSDFMRVRRFGKTYASPLMVLAFLRNEFDHSRFGFVVSKRLGKAVQRNKVKRRMREATRLRIPKIKSGFDLVLIARRPIAQASYQEIEHTLEHLIKKADLSTG
jgi:ribonuclease P protein component